jgi:hypothetical protein
LRLSSPCGISACGLDWAHDPRKRNNVISIALFAAPMRVKSNL